MKHLYNNVASTYKTYGFNMPDGSVEVEDLCFDNWLNAVVVSPISKLTGVGNCFDQSVYAFWYLLQHGIPRRDIKVHLCSGNLKQGGFLTHMFVVFRYRKQWYWVENTVPGHCGLFSFNSYHAAVSAIKEILRSQEVGFADFSYGWNGNLPAEEFLRRNWGYAEICVKYLK